MKTLLLASVLSLACLSFSGLASANPFSFKEKTCQDWSPSSSTTLLTYELRELAQAKCESHGFLAHPQSPVYITSAKTKVRSNPYGAMVLHKFCGERYFYCR